MNIAILRGSGQIGGTCIRLNSGNSEILLDLGPVSYTHLTLPTNREV